jgi:(S)-citramalyl-CoA lyase
LDQWRERVHLFSEDERNPPMTCQAPIRARSWLFTPATRPERFANAAEAGADVAILDLEDAVAPKDKAHARRDALDYLAASPSNGVLHALRINGLDTRAGIFDLEALLGSSAVPDFLVLPKTETHGHLQILDRLLTAANKETRLIGLIESAHGLAAAEPIATATPRLAGLMLGAADMAADLGSTTAWEPLAFARGRLIAACALAGVSPIDAPFFNLHDEAGLKRETAAGVALGFSAKAAIHPAQIGAINAALTPSAEAVQRARAILAENGKGVGTVDGQMIDEAVARKARRTLASAGLQA